MRFVYLLSELNAACALATMYLNAIEKSAALYFFYYFQLITGEVKVVRPKLAACHMYCNVPRAVV